MKKYIIILLLVLALFIILYAFIQKREATQTILNNPQNQPFSNPENNNSQEVAVQQQVQKTRTQSTVSIGDADNGETVTLSVGQKLIVKLTEVGSDGGFQFKNPTYNMALLEINNHYMIPNPNWEQGVVGSSPSGVWEFVAKEKGSTNLNIVTVQSWGENKQALDYSVAIVIQ